MDARHVIDRFDKDKKAFSHMQDQTQAEEADLSSLLKDAAETLEPLEPAIKVAEPTKADKGNFVSRKEVQTVIASTLQ